MFQNAIQVEASLAQADEVYAKCLAGVETNDWQRNLEFGLKLLSKFGTEPWKELGAGVDDQQTVDVKQTRSPVFYSLGRGLARPKSRFPFARGYRCENPHQLTLC